MAIVKRASFKPLAAFCYIWLMVGFFTGTLLLLGPVRAITGVLRARGYAQATEDLIMLAIIAAYIGASALLALWIYRRMGRCRTRRVRLAIPTALTLAAGICVLGWLNPAQLAGAATIGGTRLGTATGAEFVFGPYPDRARLEQLKREGFIGVISLQHPAVVPFEPVGIATESKAAAEIGIEFIHAPMLPWISSNDASLNKIREISRTAAGRYYVHCGLGRDRVNLVKHMLEREGARVASADGYMVPRTLRMRVAENRPPFERGQIREVEDDLWLVPYPNKHEFFANLLAGQVAHVTLVLDLQDPTQRGWLDEARRVLTQFSVPFRTVPFDGRSPARAREIVDAARQAPRPSAVIVPFTAPHPGTEIADALLDALDAGGQQRSSMHVNGGGFR